jgi:hypothetical protein
MVDICSIKDLTETQIQTMCSNSTIIVPVLITLVSTLLFFTIFGLSFVKKNRGRLGLILGLTALFSAVVVIWLLLSPHLVYKITQFFVGLK